MGPTTLRRLAVVAVVLVLGVLSIILIQRYQVTRLGQSNLSQAEEAAKTGDLARAEDLYLQHMQVFQDDLASKLKYAQILLDRSKTPARVNQAVGIYNEVLGREPGRDDVRRLLAETLIEAGSARDLIDARSHVSILLKANPEDGDLEYLMGRCEQAADDDRAAAESFKNAIAHKTSKRFDAYQRMATLLRGQLNEPQEADRAIQSMVDSDPGDYRVYLERGRYRQRFQKTAEDMKSVVADFQEALKRAPKEAAIYLELARVAQQQTPPDWNEAVRVLRAGLEADPKSGDLYLPLAMTELRTGNSDEAVATLRRGLEALPDNLDMRLGLADVLAQRGATIELKDQIEEINRLGMPFYVDYYTAYYYVNSREWTAAKKILLEKIQPLDLSSSPALRGSVSDLLARCYAHLGDPERQRSSLVSSVRDNPNNIQARMTWIADLVAQGDVEQAIDEYGKLVETVPQARVPLLQLLIARNQRLPAPQRDWKEVERLIALTAKDSPSSSLPVVFQAQLLLAQDKSSEAKTLLDEARSRDPRDAGAGMLWTASADLMAIQKQYAAALQILDEARSKLGDTLEFRLSRVKVLTARGGSDLVKSLIELNENTNVFNKDQQVVLFETVAGELTRRNEFQEAAKLWSQIAALLPHDLRPRLQLLSLAFQTKAEPTKADLDKVKVDVEKALAEIKQVEGVEGNTVRYGEIEYKIWQAKNTVDVAEKTQLRAEARSLLSELSSRRPDWSIIPLVTAKLDEQDLDQAKDADDKARRLNRLADLYRQAIEMGQRSLPIVQRATELLMETGRTSEVNQLWGKIPSLSGESGDLSLLERSVLDNVIRNKDYQNAVEIVRQRIEARPNDFSERILLAQLLLWEKLPDEAEAELRKAVSLDPSDPNRWVVLVQFLVSTKQIEKAEQVVKEVEKAVDPARVALTMAQCADMVGQGYQSTAREAQTASWYETAKKWYLQAQAAKPDDGTLKRTYVEFLLRTNQLVEVENQLTAFLKQPAEAKNAQDLAWAKRTLALTYVARSELQHDYQQALKALHLFAPPAMAGWKRPEAPEDLRVLARVYEAQKIIPYRKEALDVLEKLSSERQATAEDRFLLARLYSAEGDWGKAQAEYRELMQEPEKAATPQEINRQIVRIVQYASELITQIQAGGSSQDAAEAQGLIDRLKKIQPDAFNVLALQARLDKAQDKIDEAVARIKEIADRPELPAVLALATADLAESLGQIDLAQGLFKQNAAKSSRLQDHLAYAAFLGRQGRTKEALDICEPLWKSTPNPEALAPTVIEAIFAPKAVFDLVQIDRVSDWIGRSLEQNPKSALFMISLGNIRERQKRYEEAEALYRKAIAQGGADVIPLNNLAWLMTLKGDKGEKGGAPLELINRAIALRGPIPEFLDTRAVVYLTNGESKRAIEDLENAIAIDPSPVKYFHLAQAYLQASNTEAAKQSLAKARTKGLVTGNLHPLELLAYEQMLTTLE